MTVLPNAPIDDTTGLPVPTIAVATDGGVSVIKDDENVYNDTSSSGVTAGVASIEFVNDRLYYGRGGAGGNLYVKTYIGSVSANFSASHYYRYQAGGYGEVSGVYLKTNDDITVTKNKNDVALFGDTSLVLLEDKTTSSLVAYATTSYNTGWMHGDIKGALLSDTDATNITSGEILSNGDFTNGTTGWTIQNASEGSISVSSNQLTLNNSTSSDPPVACYQQISLEVGKYYNLTSVHVSGNIAVVNITTGTSDTGGTGGYGNVTYHDVAGTTRSATFLATDATMYCYIRVNTNATGNTVMDSVSIRKAEEDRSTNSAFSRDKVSALTVNGTITKSAVATGAELVSYSGFSGSNYFRQPHNADLNVGTGDFYIMCWVKGNRLMLWHRNDSGSLDMRCEFPTSGGSANKPRFLFSNGGVTLSFYATTAFDTTTWHHCVWVKRGARGGELYIDGVLNNSGTAGSDLSLDGTNSTFSIGNRADNPTEDFNGHISLFKFGASAPSAAQVKKIYEDEKMLFQENAKCTLYGSSDAVTALGYDEVTEQLHVGTSSGRSDFQGLRRINNTTTAVTTAISAHDEFIVEQ